MRIGITVHFLDSFFSAGSAQTALAVGESLRLGGHEVQLIPVGNSSLQWWTDLSGFQKEWKVGKAEGLDLVLEVGWNLLPVEERRKAKHCVWLNRKAPLIHDIEACLFPFTPAERSLDGVKEIWLFEELVSKDDVQYLELLTRLPVRLIPFVWTPSGAEIHRQTMKSPIWQQVAALPDIAGKSWTPIICETNISNTSSCIIPLFIYRRLVQEGVEVEKKIRVSNAGNVKDTEFFKYNTLDHVFDVEGCPGMAGREPEFVGRMRCVDFVYTPKSIVIAHSRFCTLRPYLLDLAWVGVPFVHNSKLLADRLGGIVSEGLYENNDILGGAAAFQKVTQAAGKTTVDSVMEVRKKILEQFSPMSPRIQKAITAAACTAASASSSAPISPSQPVREQQPFRIGFCDMWDMFNPEYNMFTLMLEAAYKGRPVVGFDITNHAVGNEQCDVILFGPFGTRWKSANAAIPKIHFTGENTPPLEGAQLNLGFGHYDAVNEAYLRLPLWMLEVNWFRADVEKLQNPKPLPIDRCTKVFMEDLEKKKKFCAFVVTNPCQPMRNAAFDWLNNYKRVDSAGRLFNNMGDQIFAGLGGGGGELKKLEFLKNYKFCLSYENQSAPGYVTEKLLHAKAAGCIPIYWGDPKVERDFNIDGCIDAREFKTREQLIEAVKKVDTDTGLWLRKFSVPAIDEVTRDRVRRTLAECARRIWSLGGLSKEEQSKIPPFIGYTSDNEEGVLVESKQEIVVESKKESVVETKEEVVVEEVKANSSLLLVTSANQRFLPSLHTWLQAASKMVAAMSNSSARVYWMADVAEDTKEEFKKTFPFADFQQLPTESPSDFPDLWDVQHFAWKIWIFQQIVQEEKLKGTLVFYTDAGSLMSRVPMNYLQKAKEEGMCVLEDSRQKNRSWCHSVFQKEMKMTEEELEGQQIWAGGMAFVAGNSRPLNLFKEAWKLAQVKRLIAGPKWAGPGVGHRHDQSILSLLTYRAKVARWPLDDVYCDLSLRHTFLKGAAVYVHRGQFKVHEPVLEGIDDAWVINLDRRADRMEKFRAAQPLLAERALRLPAFDAKKLKLTPAIARLFAPHDFKWKKAVMGCALSHLALWTKLVNEPPDINSYLIMEDDAKLHPTWRDRWEEMMTEKALPDGWDVVYLGGVLPPNKEGFQQCIEPVNDHLARVKENSVFGQNPPNRYFHFCAYAYVLSRQGAMKVLEVLKSKGGYWTSADHMICNLAGFLNIYFMNPLVAGCYQDDDPVYQKSQFNDFSRKDNFDSDLWNNNDHFSAEEVAAQKGCDSLDIMTALEDARRAMLEDEKQVAPVETKPIQKVKEEVQNKSLVLPPLGKRRIVSFHDLDMSKLYEFAWLKQLLHESAGISLHCEKVSGPQEDEPIVIVQRPHMEMARRILEEWHTAGKGFFVLHLSDEFGTDPVDFYQWPECKGVIRNYLRKDVPDSEKVKTIPLGFHWAIPNGEPYIHTPAPPFRDFVWSFVGTGWQGRGTKLQVLKGLPGDHKCVIQEDWDSKDKMGREETLGILLNSWFVPCPGGQNGETFRIYEAMEAGAVPVLVKEEGMEGIIELLGKWIPFLLADSWQHAAGLIHTLRDKPEVYERYRNTVLSGWENCKKDVKGWVKEVLGL